MTVDGGGSGQPGAADLASSARAPGKLFERVRLLIAVVICGAVVCWAGRVAWETRNATVAAARNLRSSDPSLRLEAVQEVSVRGLTNPKDAIPALIGALEDQDEKVRTAAARQIGFVGSHAIRSDANADVVGQAAIALRVRCRTRFPWCASSLRVRWESSGGLVSPFPGAARAQDAEKREQAARARLTRGCWRISSRNWLATRMPGYASWSGKHWGLSVPSWGSSCLKS